MAVPSYLATFLWTQQLQGQAKFVEKFPGWWLLWEPGAWKAPPRNAQATLRVETGATTPQPGDALCFFLGGPDGRSLSIGRESASDIHLSDGTVSRQHALLTGQNGEWRIRAISDKTTRAGGKPVTSAGLILKPATKLQIGGVHLSIHDGASLRDRLVS